ncbi:ABC transporter permease [Microterricola viridarii]|uniref:Monosaccharide ABC transporter membrane protein, CUT2 family n=1 Tax=Microterricola viridarii TaxID=412690 RepID=A0A1H1ZKU3_9MICO|nr:ABC transporter permease [Microterricola viridarii]SDT34348.1 monosaccharide ABC transporter membrane protein, CUT2 family [Microterricola viridarii]
MNAVSARRRSGRRLDSTVIVYLALIGVIAIGAILVATVGRSFFSAGNIRDILTGMSVLGFVAIGQTLVILCGSLDLSVPYVISLSSLLAADIMKGNPANIAAAVAVALGVAALLGLANGLIVTKLKVHGFIATLGMGLIIKGYLDTNYKGTSGSVPWEFQLIGATGIGPVPVSTVIMLAVALLAALFLNRTRVGNHIYAVGGNEQVARLSGIRTANPVILAHVLCSVSAAMAGLLLASRLGVGSPTVGTQGGYDLLSIAAVVLGGTLLAGGRGSIWGTIGGVAIFAVLDNVMSVLQVNPFMKDVVRGIVIVAAVAVYTGRQVERRRARFGPGGSATEREGDAGPDAQAPAPASASAQPESTQPDSTKHSAAQHSSAQLDTNVGDRS